MRVIPFLDATAPGAIIGRHSLWFPALGLKVPFQWGGAITKYGFDEALYTRETIPHEVAILRALAEHGMAPPVREIVYIETLVTKHRGAWHADPCGAIGYEMADATKLPPGRFDFEAMRRLPIEGSPTAWGDVGKPGNVVNGYLVDVRRSAFDMLRWAGPLPSIEPPAQDLAALRAQVHRDCQFPAGQRREAYQDFWIAGRMEQGQRRVVERAQAMGFAPTAGQSVLDIGCQSGSFLQFAHNLGARHLAGVEISPEYVAAARALARSCGQNICIRQMDVTHARADFLAWVRACYPRGVDHLLLLSMEKHIDIWPLVDAIGARTTYIETNAVAEDDGRGPEPAAPYKLRAEVERRGGAFVGSTRDRNLRRLYRIERR